VKEEYHKWYTQYLNREFEMLAFGHSGYPVILFPPSQGRYYQCKDSGLIDSAAGLINEGKVKIYCPDGIDSESWYNYSVDPSERVKIHNAYEALVLYDVIEFAKHETGLRKVCAAGCGFGGYHALNIAMKHPDKTAYLFCMSGTFDIKQFIMGYYDDNCYFNNPLDYLPNLEEPWYLDRIKRMKIILGAGEHDIFLEENKRISGILNSKGIDHLLDIRHGAEHDWPGWRQMFPHYLSQIAE